MSDAIADEQRPMPNTSPVCAPDGTAGVDATTYQHANLRTWRAAQFQARAQRASVRCYSRDAVLGPRYAAEADAHRQRAHELYKQAAEEREQQLTLLAELILARQHRAQLNNDRDLVEANPDRSLSLGTIEGIDQAINSISQEIDKLIEEIKAIGSKNRDT